MNKAGGIPSRGWKKRTPMQREQDMCIVMELAVKYRKSCRAIAKILNEMPDRAYTVTHQMVWSDMKLVERRWREYALEQLATARGRILMHISKQREELWEVWERSKKSKEGANTERYGDVAIMNELTKLNEQESKLLGLFAPVKSEVAVGATNEPEIIIVKWADELSLPSSNHQTLPAKTVSSLLPEPVIDESHSV